jgi:hypothetical protein
MGIILFHEALVADADRLIITKIDALKRRQTSGMPQNSFEMTRMPL